MKVMKFIMKKNRIFLFALFVLLANAGCASERFRVPLTDVDGSPISNAVVSLGFHYVQRLPPAMVSTFTHSRIQLWRGATIGNRPRF